MKLNLDAPILGVDGKARQHYEPKVNEYGMPLKGGDGEVAVEHKGDLVLKTVLGAAVNATYKKDGEISPSELLARGKLARRIHSGGEKNFDNDDISRMVKLVGLRYQHDPMLVLSVVEMIDPDNKELKVQDE